MDLSDSPEERTMIQWKAGIAGIFPFNLKPNFKYFNGKRIIHFLNLVGINYLWHQMEYVYVYVCVYKVPKNVIVKLLKTNDRENLENIQRIVTHCI